MKTLKRNERSTLTRRRWGQTAGQSPQGGTKVTKQGGETRIDGLLLFSAFLWPTRDRVAESGKGQKADHREEDELRGMPLSGGRIFIEKGNMDSDIAQAAGLTVFSRGKFKWIAVNRVGVGGVGLEVAREKVDAGCRMQEGQKPEATQPRSQKPRLAGGEGEFGAGIAPLANERMNQALRNRKGFGCGGQPQFLIFDILMRLGGV
jgi:hypothetical protein